MVSLLVFLLLLVTNKGSEDNKVKVTVAVAGLGTETYTKNKYLIIKNENNGDQIEIPRDAFYVMESVNDGDAYNIIQSDESNVDDRFKCKADNQRGIAKSPFLNIWLICGWNYKWVSTGTFGKCSVSCGGGLQQENFKCNGGKDADCSDPKPTTNRECGMDACPSSWISTDTFGKCSVSCGGGLQKEIFKCSSGFDVDCSEPRPTGIRECGMDACPLSTNFVVFAGDFNAITDPNDWLTKCSAKLSPVNCISIESGSIKLTYEGTSSQLISVTNDLVSNGLSLTGYPDYAVKEANRCYDYNIEKSSIDDGIWHNAFGKDYTCDWYKDKSACSVIGDAYAMYGFVANQACCTCGGGNWKITSTAPTALASKCGNTPDWKDQFGDSCAMYKNRNYCARCDTGKGWNTPNWGDMEIYGALIHCKESCGCCNLPGTYCDGGKSKFDECGVCGGDDSSCKGCDGVVWSGKKLDQCDVCDGDNTSCAGCDKIPNSKKEWDECGKCGGDNTSCAGCDGIPNSGKKIDECKICGGDNTSCAGCDDIPNSGKEKDVCGICGGDGMSCRGCDGILFSGKVKDKCGICDGDNKSCAGCDGIPHSKKEFDKCGKCGGDNTSCVNYDFDCKTMPTDFKDELASRICKWNLKYKSVAMTQKCTDMYYAGSTTKDKADQSAMNRCINAGQKDCNLWIITDECDIAVADVNFVENTLDSRSFAVAMFLFACAGILVMKNFISKKYKVSNMYSELIDEEL